MIFLRYVVPNFKYTMPKFAPNYTIMTNCASQIHTHRTDKKKRTIDDGDIARVTDWIVVVRDYDMKHNESRRKHAKTRCRKPNGRF